LRERESDTLQLAEHLLVEMASRMGMEKLQISPAAGKKLLAHDFPGNVRELENILERAVTLCEKCVIEEDDIEIRIDQTAAMRLPTLDAAGAPLESQLEDIERDAIVQALEQTRYNKTAAAKLLGISFRALRYRIKKLGLE
ncbi:MAG: helix-turn-helix domain-containing protein, partial [Gammaproteobacteria bacterium]